MTDSEFESMVDLTDVKWLCLSECTLLTDAAFQTKILESGASVVSIDLSYVARLSDSGVRSVSQVLRLLVEIRLDGCTSLTDASMRHLSTCCRKLVLVSVKYCPKISDDGVECLARELSSLRSLYLNHCNVADRGLHALSNSSFASRLCVLDLTSCARVSDVGVLRLVSKSVNIEYLSLSDCPLITDSSISAIATSLFSLTHLCISGSKTVTDKAIALLERRSKSLVFVDLSFCSRVVDQHFQQYKPLNAKAGFLQNQPRVLRPNASEEACLKIRRHREAMLSECFQYSGQNLSGLGSSLTAGWGQKQQQPLLQLQLHKQQQHQQQKSNEPTTPTSPPVSMSLIPGMPRRKGYLAKATKVEATIYPPYTVAAPPSAAGLKSSVPVPLPNSADGIRASIAAGNKPVNFFNRRKKDAIQVHGKVRRNHLNGQYDIEFTMPGERVVKASQIRLLPGSRYSEGQMANQHVEVNYREQGSWVPSTITKEPRIDKSGAFEVKYDIMMVAMEVPEADLRVNGMTADEYLTSATHGPSSIHTAGSTTYTSPVEQAGRAWLQKKNSCAAGSIENASTSAVGKAHIFGKKMLDIVPPHHCDDLSFCNVLRT